MLIFDYSDFTIFEKIALTQDDDIELVTRLHKSDVAAFDILYWKYHQKLFANIVKLIKDEETAKDVLQEAFIALWDNRSSIDEEKSISGWLFVTSYNKSITYLKKSLKESIVNQNQTEETDPLNEQPFTVKEMQFQLLENALNELSPQKRRVFELCKLQGKTYEDAAKELNISKHTVKEYLSAAVTSVKEYINAHPNYLLSFPFSLLISRFLS